MAGKFEVYEDRSGKYRFQLKTDGDGGVVRCAEAFDSPEEAAEACRAFKEAADGAEIVDLDGGA